ncbi:36528_t:CDS:2 [Gigaspora margarita]|uniref:36528_t:CDS:1 n=1 Tax=Gigaspora margarita TaxID=4874 RepID=A0ABN7U3R3_GIGMA|nr:36528_t:CDS:2 [Gigaspora margarita]
MENLSDKYVSIDGFLCVYKMTVHLQLKITKRDGNLDNSKFLDKKSAIIFDFLWWTINENMSGRTNHTQAQINNGQPRRLQNINIVGQLPRPQNNANQINNTIINQQHNDLINGTDPFNRMQCSLQEETQFSTSLFSGISFP